MRFSLATLTRRANPGIRRKSIVIRDIAPPATLATDLYRGSYLPVIEAWERAIPGILAEYERTLSTMTSDAIPERRGDYADAMLHDAPDDIQARLDAAETDLERLFILLDAAMKDWSLRTERWQREKWRGAVLSATGVDINTLIGPEDARETLQAYINWNVRLIRDVSAQAEKRISDAVFSGLQNRTPAREVAKQIHDGMAMSRRRAQGIASDMLSKVTSALADERRRQAGLGIWKWRHSGKKHPREWHLERNGNLYADSEGSGEVGREVDGSTVLAPPEEKDRPGRPPWCGCRAQAVLILD